MNILSLREYRPRCIYLNVFNLCIKNRVLDTILKGSELRHRMHDMGSNLCIIRTYYTIFYSYSDTLEIRKKIISR